MKDKELKKQIDKTYLKAIKFYKKWQINFDKQKVKNRNFGIG